MPQPLIGLTSYHSLTKSGLPALTVVEAYVRAVAGAGGAPVVIPLGLDEKGLDELLARLDGVLFTGGGDIAPERYHSQPHPKVSEVDNDRDRVELYLVRQVAQQGKPFLGICRGIQVINVALGGSLYEDILDQHAGAIKHDYYPGLPRNYLAHTVSIQNGSSLARILGGDEVQVNSLHHQGVREAAPLLRPLAYAPDGILEAFELPDHPFGLAVQWHPEWLQEHEPMRRLFQAFVQAATADGKNS